MHRNKNWLNFRNKIIKKQNERCSRCGYIHNSKIKSGRLSVYSDLVLDHITPMALGGTDSEDNLQTLCIDCNKQKNRWDQSMIAKQKRLLKNG